MNADFPIDAIAEVRAHAAVQRDKEIARDRRKLEYWRVARQATLLFLLVYAYLQYFLLDMTCQALALPTVAVSVPVPYQPGNFIQPPSLR